MIKYIGFSLVEVMIVVIIVGILSALSIPLYSEHLIHEKRLAAEMNLVKLAEELEQYYMTYNTYENATLENLNIPKQIADNQYQLVISTTTATAFSIAAIPQGHQSKHDFACGTLMLDSKSKRMITGTGDVSDCWR